MVRATALRDQHDDAGGYCHGEQAGYQRDDNGGALRIMGAGLAQFIDRIGSSVRSIGHDFARLARGGNGIDHAGHRRIGLGFGCLIGLIIRSVIVIAGKPVEEIREEEIRAWEEMPIEEHMEHYLSQGMDKKEAMKAVAKDRGISKRDVYQQLL